MDVFTLAENAVMYVILLLAVGWDLRYTKISNKIIFAGLCISCTFQFYQGGIMQVVSVIPKLMFPVVTLYLFYVIRVLGAGDIKLFSVIGSFLSWRDLIICIALSFVIGAALSLGKLVWKRAFLGGMGNVAEYFIQVAQGGGLEYKHRSTDNIIHFSIAILLGVITTQLFGQYLGTFL